jgi:hypothetical protein
MALKDRVVKSARQQAGKETGIDRPFAEIDAKKFERARHDPKVRAVHAAADKHMETLRAEGRID